MKRWNTQAAKKREARDQAVVNGSNILNKFISKRQKTVFDRLSTQARRTQMAQLAIKMFGTQLHKKQIKLLSSTLHDIANYRALIHEIAGA